MKTLSMVLVVVIVNLTLPCVAQNKDFNNLFYCFGNAMNLPNAPKRFDDQAILAKKIGYQAMSGSGEQNYFEFRKALDRVGLAMPEIYIELNLDQGIASKDSLLKKIIRDSKGRDLLITLPIVSKLYKNNPLEGDIKLVEILTPLADYAAAYQVKLAIYPHYLLYCESILL